MQRGIPVPVQHRCNLKQSWRPFSSCHQKHQPPLQGQKLICQAGYNNYLAQGAFRPHDLNPINIRVGSSADGQPLTAQLQVTVPLGLSSRCPLVILSAGFLLDGSQYRSYCQELATWGYVALIYDCSELLDDRQSVVALRTMMDACSEDPQVSAYLDPNKGVLLVGHSRGAKLSVLAAAADARVHALVLLDPVNNTAMTPTGAGYPSALQPLRQLTSGDDVRSRCYKRLPVLIVGATMNADVVPKDAGYRRFFDACVGPVWMVEIPAGHLQFLDRQSSFLAMFSAPGSSPDAAVRAVAKAATIAFLEGITSAGSAQRKFEEQAQGFKSMAPGTTCIIRNMELLKSSESTRGTQSSAHSQKAAASGNSSSPDSSMSLETLMALKASAIKTLLKDRNINCIDCFDKESLARRYLGLS